jgi:ABC-type Mn2+/Zn2+ transport system permease subunit
MIGWLAGPLSYGFMQRGLVASVAVGIVCAVVGCYVVLRSMAFLGDALAHAILPGVAVAYLLQVDLTLGALAAAVLVALGIAALSRGGEIKEDTSIGIMFSAALALGVALISSMHNYAVDLSHILFGDVLGVSPQGLALTIGVAVAVLAIVLVNYRPFLVISFDPVFARTLRLPIGLLNNVLMLLLALVTVVSIQTVGISLVAAMLVTPAATAYLLVRRLPAMMAVSAAIGAFSSAAGLYLSYYLGISSGASIVLVVTAVFLVVFAVSPRRGSLLRSRTTAGQAQAERGS